MNGEYNQGDLLPTEKELIAQFGVSKHTVRESLRALEEMGFISMKRGASGGPEVRSIDWQTARDGFAGFLYFQDVSIKELSDMRKILEPHIARKAAELFDANIFGELAEVHEKCSDFIKKKQCAIEGWTKFHVLLAKLSGNKVLWVMLDFVNNALANKEKLVKPDSEFSAQVQADHQKIMDAIQAKDPDAAASHMYNHICEVERRIKNSENRRTKLRGSNFSTG